MVENDDIESFSQTFSQFNLSGEIFQVNSQSVDPTIFDQCTPDLEFLCETIETNSNQINNSETENLIGFLKGESITERNIDSLSSQLTSSDSVSSIGNKPKLNFNLKAEPILKTYSSDDLKDYNLKEKVELSLANEIELLTKRNLNSQLDFSSKNFLTDVCSPIVTVEEFVLTTYKESQNLHLQCNMNELIDTEILINSDITPQEIALKTQIHDYIECKRNKTTRGRPLKVIHIKPNLNKIIDAGKFKYVSRRYKNNIASQYSRIKRNLKGKELKKENKKLEQKNQELKLERKKWKGLQVKLLKEIRNRNIYTCIHYDKELFEHK